MKHLLFILLLLPFTGIAQDTLLQPTIAPPPPPPPPSEEVIEETHDFSEIEPEYPGGNQAMIKFIVKNVNYPVIAKEAGIQGKVYVQFEIATTGQVENIKVVRRVHPSLDKEAIRVMKLMPKWKPGESHGKKVRVRMYLPIVFKLS